MKGAFAADRLPYDRGRLRPRVFHFGVGAFHRAHQAAYLHRLAAAGGDAGIIGASLRSPAVRDSLAPQDFAYTLVERDATGDRPEPIGVLLDVIGPGDHGAITARIASAQTELVTVTVSEKAYGVRGGDRGLDLAHPAVGHDLAHPDHPVGLVGRLVAGLGARRDTCGGDLVIASCDNLPSNGSLLRSLVLEFAGRTSPDLTPWIEQHVSFPDTMVDRIVPATDDELRARVRELTGLDDAWPVQAEPFIQWVMDAAGAPPRIDLASVGVQLSHDVGAWERLKLRLLNGPHSAAAYVGESIGHATIAAAMTDPATVALLTRLADEVVPHVGAPDGSDANEYAATVRERFTNPRLDHRCRQIAMDGSQKLPQRIVAPFRDALAAGTPTVALTRVLALWVRFLAANRGRVDDPLAPVFCDLWDRHPTVRDFATAALALPALGLSADTRRIADLVTGDLAGTLDHPAALDD